MVSPATIKSLDVPNGYLTENRGQVAEGIRYYSMGNPSVAFRDDGVMFVISVGISGDARQTMDAYGSRFPPRDGGITSRSVAYLVRFDGGRTVNPVGVDRLPFNTNFFIGRERSSWRTDVPSFRKVLYEDVYDGVDVVYHSSSGGMKYEFLVGPGADVGAIQLTLEGVESVRLDQRDIVAKTSLAEVRDSAPVAFQENSQIDCDFVLRGPFSYGFECQDRDSTSPFVIDPLVYSTFIGDFVQERLVDMKVDSQGNAYLTGDTTSPQFPTVPGSFDVTFNQSSYARDAFVLKLNSTGTGLLYSTFIGGNSTEWAGALSVDSQGSAYVGGQTNSKDFPATPSGYWQTVGNITVPYEAFVVKLNPTGNDLVYSAVFGGMRYSRAYALAVDNDGNAYVAGSTISVDFPTTPGAYKRVLDGSSCGMLACDDIFISKLNAAGSALIYSTYLGGNGNDDANSIALDTDGNAYITGNTNSTDFVHTPGALDIQPNWENCHSFACSDAFVTKLNASGSTVTYSTYLGGCEMDSGSSITVGADGSIYVAGTTESSTFPTTPDAYMTAFHGADMAFVTRLDPSGTRMVFSTLLGGGTETYAVSLHVDPAGNAYVAGSTSGPFPVTRTAISTTYAGGGSDVIMAGLDSTGSALIYGTYLGGADIEYASALAMDSDGDAYVAGLTRSSIFPVTAGAFDTTYGHEDDIFVTKFPVIVDHPPVASNLGVQGFTSEPGILNITEANPWLSWTYEDAEYDTQIEYEVRVGTSPGGSDMWSNRWYFNQLRVKYEGASLSDYTDYWFAVRVKDSAGWSSWAEVKFRTGDIPSPPAVVRDGTAWLTPMIVLPVALIVVIVILIHRRQKSRASRFVQEEPEQNAQQHEPQRPQ